jgi:hypothetical protein
MKERDKLEIIFFCCAAGASCETDDPSQREKAQDLARECERKKYKGC